jgi:putative restriction endonuclease
MPGTYVLPAWHREVLGWFEVNAGRTLTKRPFDVGLAVKVTSAQKGIWKSALSPYAISVVQTPKGVYADQDPVFYSDGTWSYFYHQEGKTEVALAEPERIFANAALFKCKADRVPVGVVLPAENGKGYQVLGLAYVEGYSQGYFELVGPVSIGATGELFAEEAPSASSSALIGFPIGEFDPSATQDNRLKVIAEVRRRQGGARFRRALLQAYDSRCAMTRYDATPALEAAHILPYRGPQTNHVANGLLLRADMHDLFDLGLIAVDTSAMRLLVADDLVGTEYEQYSGKSIWVPREVEARPSIEALEKHRVQSLVA